MFFGPCKTWASACMLLSWAAVASADPVPLFTEEAHTRGISYFTQYLESTIVGMAGGSQGACFADLDNDGDPDLVLVGDPGGVVGVFENDGTGHFVQRSNTGMPSLIRASSISAADFDNDGDLDVFIPQIVYPNSLVAPHYLMRNNGNFEFTDVAASAGILPGGSVTGTTWGDYDGDGFLDLHVGTYSWSASPLNDRLYHNRGNGSFEEVAAQLGVNDPGGFTFQPTFIDYDLDGDADLYVVNDRGGISGNPGNALFRNLGNGTFEDVSDVSGCGVEMFSMGVAFGDLNRDGYPDLYVSNIQDNVLLMGSGSGIFTESASQYGVLVNSVSWGNMFFDMDNDGWLDLYVCNTPLAGVGSPAPALFHCHGTPPCENVTPSAGLVTTTGSYGIASADIDNDGDVDLVVVPPSAPVQLYINQTNGGSWLKVRLVGDPPNRFAVGATVWVDDGSGPAPQHRAVVAGHSYKSQSDLVQHFGVGAASVIPSVTVRWPGGATTSVTNVAVNQTLTMFQSCTAPLAATSPNPANGAVSVATDAALHWSGPASAMYAVHFGASSNPPAVGTTDQTVWTLAILEPATTYYWRVDSLGCTTTAGSVWSFTTDSIAAAPNTLSVHITAPTSQPSWNTEVDHVTISGGSSDETAVTSVSWTTDHGGTGTCNTSNNWTDWNANIPLDQGLNRITVTAIDSDAHVATDDLIVSYTPAPATQPAPPPAPVATTPIDLQVLQPPIQAALAYTMPEPSIDISGTASAGVVSVTWSNDRGGGDLCGGTTSWSASRVPLAMGINVITIEARDGHNASTSRTVAVNHPDLIAPLIAVRTPSPRTSFQTDARTITIAGLASDANGVEAITWTAGSAGGVAVGTEVWLIEDIPLSEDQTDIVITARDVAGNQTSLTYTVNRPPRSVTESDEALTDTSGQSSTSNSGSVENALRPAATQGPLPSGTCGMGMAGFAIIALLSAVVRVAKRVA